MAKQGPRKKLPKELAVINADNCTGCEACLEVCPVDCIIKIQQYDQFYNLQSWCEIDLERCVGCEVCVHIPGKKSNPYDLKVCPWDAIEMVPTEEVAQVVAEIGGPPKYIVRELGPPGRHGPASGRAESGELELISVAALAAHCCPHLHRYAPHTTLPRCHLHKRRFRFSMLSFARRSMPGL